MGAEESILKNYEVGSPYEIDNLSQEVCDVNRTAAPKNEATSGPKLEFRVCPAVHKENGSSISILIFDKKKKSGSQHGINNADVLRMVRHPFILKYMGLSESDRSIKLLTEHVLPLEYCIHDLEDIEITAGLHNILEALIFMHKKGCLVHKNICWSSIFVSRKDGSWKLGGMEKVEKLSPKGVEQDVYDCTNLAISLMDYVENGGHNEKAFIQRLQDLNMKHQDNKEGNECLDTDHLKALLDEPVFKNNYLEISKFFNEITMKEEREKEIFFRSLADKLRSIDHTVVVKKLLKRLFSKITLAEPSAEKFFIPELLAFGTGNPMDNCQPIFPDDIYRKYCVPLILNLLFCNETHVRLLLLKHMPLFVDAIDKETLQDEVLPEILLGVRDENDDIVSATLHGLACLVKILGGDVVIGGERTKLFKDHRPKFASAVSSDYTTDRRIVTSEQISPEASQQSREAMQKRKEERKRQNELRRQARERERQKKSETVTAVARQDTSAVEVSPGEYSNEPSVEAVEEPENTDVVKLLRNDESDPDWEGFEAFSSSSEAEEVNDSKLAKSSRSAESLLLFAKDSLSMEKYERQNTINSRNSIESEAKTQQVVETPQFQRLDSYNSVNSRESKDSVSASISPVYRGEAKQGSTGKSTKIVQKLNKKLGEEFELQISVNRTTEPDFFADMTPDLSKVSTVMIERNLPVVSSKFEAHDASAEVTTGWEDEGWDDFS